MPGAIDELGRSQDCEMRPSRPELVARASADRPRHFERNDEQLRRDCSVSVMRDLSVDARRAIGELVAAAMSC